MYNQNGTFIVIDSIHLTMHSDNLWCKITRCTRIETWRRSYQKSKSKSDWWSKYPFYKMSQLLRNISIIRIDSNFVSKFENIKQFSFKYRQLRPLQQHCQLRLCAIRQQELFQTIVIERNELFLIFQLKVDLEFAKFQLIIKTDHIIAFAI